MFKGVGVPTHSSCIPVVMSLVYWDVGSMYFRHFIKASGGGMKLLALLQFGPLMGKIAWESTVA